MQLEREKSRQKDKQVLDPFFDSEKRKDNFHDDMASDRV
jgi:hypothetical protein